MRITGIIDALVYGGNLEKASKKSQAEDYIPRMLSKDASSVVGIVILICSWRS
jgi:hypothetical protein